MNGRNMINERIDIADNAKNTRFWIGKKWNLHDVPNVPKSQFRTTVYVTANLKIFYLKYFECGTSEKKCICCLSSDL